MQYPGKPHLVSVALWWGIGVHPLPWVVPEFLRMRGGGRSFHMRGVHFDREVNPPQWIKAKLMKEK